MEYADMKFVKSNEIKLKFFTFIVGFLLAYLLVYDTNQPVILFMSQNLVAGSRKLRLLSSQGYFPVVRHIFKKNWHC